MEHSGEGFLLSSLLASTISICSRRKAALLGPCPCVAISSSDSLPGWSCEFGPFASYGVEGGARSQPSLGIGNPLVGRTLACCSWSWADTNWDKGLGRTNRNLSQNSLAELSTGTAHPSKPLSKQNKKGRDKSLLQTSPIQSNQSSGSRGSIRDRSTGFTRCSLSIFPPKRFFGYCPSMVSSRFWSLSPSRFYLDCLNILFKACYCYFNF
jgi:hypothetical protein